MHVGGPFPSPRWEYWKSLASRRLPRYSFPPLIVHRAATWRSGLVRRAPERLWRWRSHSGFRGKANLQDRL